MIETLHISVMQILEPVHEVLVFIVQASAKAQTNLRTCQDRLDPLLPVHTIKYVPAHKILVISHMHIFML